MPVVAQLKSTLPRPLWIFARRAVVYVRRLRIWAGLVFELGGVRFRDKVGLGLSAMCAPFTALRDLDRWRDPVCFFDIDVRVRNVGCFRTRRRSDDLWHASAAREQDIVAYFRKTIRPGDVVVDAGANIGFYTVLAAKLVGNSGHVFAFEMVEETANLLRHNISLNRLQNVTVIQKALSNESSRRIAVAVPEGDWGQASINRRSEQSGADSIVETITLDDAIADRGAVRIVKMDLEGAEPAAISGGRRLLTQTQALVFERRPKSSEQAAFSKGSIELTDLGFEIRALDGANAVAERPPAGA